MRANRYVAAMVASSISTVAAAAERPSQPDPDLDARNLVQFDRPIGTAKTVLPPRPNDPNPLGVVRCFHYPEFTVKELDYGEHGDTAISVTPAAGPGRARCGKQDDPGEKVMLDGRSSYFLGSKSGYLFLVSTLGGDGLEQFFVYDGQTGKRLLKAVATLRKPFALSAENGRLSIGYESGVSGRCSLLTGGSACWARFGRFEQLPAPIASRPAPLAGCEAAYGGAPASGPAVPRNDPSVVYYETSLTLDKAGTMTNVTYGALTCTYAE